MRKTRICPEFGMNLGRMRQKIDLQIACNQQVKNLVCVTNYTEKILKKVENS